MEKNLKRTTPRARFALTNTWRLAIVWRRAHESTFRLRPRISSTAVRGPFLGWSGNNNNKKNREVWGEKTQSGPLYHTRDATSLIELPGFYSVSRRNHQRSFLYFV